MQTHKHWQQLSANFENKNALIRFFLLIENDFHYFISILIWWRIPDFIAQTYTVWIIVELADRSVW